MSTPLSRPEFAAATGLSVLAGYIDGIAFLFLGGFFVSFMSGNTTQGGVELVRGGAWWSALVLVCGFVLGVVVGTVLGRLRRRRAAAILGFVALMVLVGTLLAETASPVLLAAGVIAAGMGAVNTVFVSNGQTLGLTYLTGALVKVGQQLVEAFTGGSRTAWLHNLAIWVAIPTGAAAGAAVYSALGMRALWLGAAGAVIAALVAAVAARGAATSAGSG